MIFGLALLGCSVRQPAIMACLLTARPNPSTNKGTRRFACLISYPTWLARIATASYKMHAPQMCQVLQAWQSIECIVWGHCLKKATVQKKQSAICKRHKMCMCNMACISPRNKYQSEGPMIQHSWVRLSHAASELMKRWEEHKPRSALGLA